MCSDFRSVGVLWSRTYLDFKTATAGFFTHSLKPLIKLDVSERGKVDQRCSLYPKVVLFPQHFV